MDAKNGYFAPATEAHHFAFALAWNERLDEICAIGSAPVAFDWRELVCCFLALAFLLVVLFVRLGASAQNQLASFDDPELPPPPGYTPPGQQPDRAAHQGQRRPRGAARDASRTRPANLFRDLKQNDFRVFENKIEQKISVFSREDIPVTMGLVIDNSGSMREKREQVNAAAMTFVQDQQSAGRSVRRQFQRRVLSRYRRRFHERSEGSRTTLSRESTRAAAPLSTTP